MRESVSVKHDFRFQTLNDPELERMLAAAMKFCSDMASGVTPYWISFVGTSGAGKSHLIKQIWRFFQEQGQWYECPKTGANLVHDGRFVFWPKVVAKMKEGDYGPISDLQNLWFCCIDDLSSDNDPSGNARDNMATIAERRMGKWTAITSNLNLSQIQKKLDTRIASRMVREGNQVIDVETKDFSLRNL